MEDTGAQKEVPLADWGEREQDHTSKQAECSVGFGGSPSEHCSHF